MVDFRHAAANVAAAVIVAHASIASATIVDLSELVGAAIRLPCEAARGTGLNALAELLPDARSRRNGVSFSLAGIVERRMMFSVGANELTVRFRGPNGDPHQVSVRYVADRGRRPLVLAIASTGCIIHTARLLSYDDSGRPERLEGLGSLLRPTGETYAFNPEVPPGEDPPGLPVGHVDTGVNYLLPEIAARLARDASGQILGYDFWDLDRRPFDVSLASDPFFPEHHGTETASLLLAEARVAKLVPYRYPRDDMTRMGALVADAARHGIRVMNVSLASGDRLEWRSILEAAQAHPQMLFVAAAGNYGRNIDNWPVYPASAVLANMVVVTSATLDGRLTEGVNWGPHSVDLMVPAEGMRVLDFDGRERRVSGSSYAAARVSALAACLLAGHPAWSTDQLKAALFALARPSPDQVTRGFISGDVLGGRACAVHS